MIHAIKLLNFVDLEISILNNWKPSLNIFQIDIIPIPIKNCAFERVKAPGFDDYKLVNIRNMDQLIIIKPRELSRGSNAQFLTGIGITPRKLAEIKRSFCNYSIKDKQKLKHPRSTIKRFVQLLSGPGINLKARQFLSMATLQIS